MKVSMLESFGWTTAEKKNHKTGGGKRARKKHDEKVGVRMYYVSSLDMWLRNQVFSPNSDPCRHFPL